MGRMEWVEGSGFGLFRVVHCSAIAREGADSMIIAFNQRRKLSVEKSIVLQHLPSSSCRR